jgi:site-specific recombinase XerD
MDHLSFSSSARCRGMDSLLMGALKHLEDLGYNPGTIANYRNTWKEFQGFVQDRSGTEAFSTDMVHQFLDSHGISSEKAETGLTFHQRHVRTVMRVLTEFALHGCFQLCGRSSKEVKLTTEMGNILCDYEQFCRDHLKNPTGTMRIRKRDIARFLHYLDSRSIATVKEIQRPVLSGFVLSCAHLKSATLARLISSIRSFLRYLCMKGEVSSDLVEQMPKVRVGRDERIPSVWKSEDVDALLATVDRSSPPGKRDYAILLLAARLGIRASDIRNLRFEHLLWDQARIEMKQTKSDEPLSLPLSEEIGHALIDYLRHGRPLSHHREVFLRANAPFEPFGHDNNLHHIVTKYRRRANIDLPARSRRGLHSLRHTVASRLLEAGTPLETISGIMGHLSIETTRIYTKIDVEALRSVAIDLEEVAHA